jgi:hypothetical protein
VREELARGGMGVVYRVLDTYVEREVAQKRLHVPEEALRARFMPLFQNEYDTLAQLAHPRVVEVFEYGVDAEGPYYTMELLGGVDLARTAPLSVAETCRVLRDVASVLALVHARRLVYRDLSPSNVRLTEDGRAKLIDFGALTPFGVPKEIVGTAALMAPECLHRKPLDARTDLYALGALAYWCLTHRHAVRTSSIADLEEALCYPIQPPSELASGIPPALDELVLALLNHDPLARPASAAELMDRLTAIGALAPEQQTERVAASYLMHPPLVGRSEQLALLVHHLENACRQGRGHAVLLEAARGLGRTALAGQLMRHAQLNGASVLRSQSGAQGGPLSVVRPLLSAALAAEPSLAHAHPLAAQLCAQSEAAAPPSRSAGEGAEQQARLIASVQACLLEFTKRTPAAFVVDDVHSADAESLGLLVSLAHAAPAHQLLIVVTSASDEVPAHAHAHARLVEATTRVALTPLDEEQLTTLATSIFGAVPNNRRLAMWLHQHGGGNPARCMALARLLLQRGAIQYVTGTFSLPYDVSDDSLEQELSAATDFGSRPMSDGARGAAELLSVYDEAVTLEHLAQSAGLPKRELVLALEELTRLAIVRQVDGCFSFVHDSLRNSVLEALPEQRAQLLHLQVARALLSEPVCPIDRRRQAGYHLLRGQASEEGLALLGTLAPELSRSPEALGKAVPALEAALALHGRLSTSAADGMPLLVPLALAGYYRDPKLLAPYLGRTLEILLQITGTKLAQRTRGWLGGKLAFLLGLLYARVRYTFSMLRVRISFTDMFTALFAVAGTSAAASCAAFDFAFAYAMGEALEPFATLGPKHPANIVREFCLTTARSRMGPLAPAEQRFDKLIERLSRPAMIAGLDEEVRVQVTLGALYAGGMVKLLRASTNGLAIADRMDAQGRAFYRPHAELLRMLHYAMRGEQHLAEPHRERTELLALLGGSGWSAVNNTAHRSILVYQWTQDSMNLLRVITDLKRFAPVNAAVEPHIQLAEAYVELMRGRAERAVAQYEAVFSRFPALSCWTLTGERGRYAEALNGAGEYGKARLVCKQVLASLDPGEREYPFLTHVVEQQLALAEAQLGDVHGAADRLQALMTEVRASENPLLIGSLHRDRAHVARIARDATAFEEHAAAMSKWFRATKNPALIQQCERCGSEGLKAGLPVPWQSTTHLLDPMFSHDPKGDGTDSDDCTAFVSEAELKSQRVARR